MEHMFRQLLEGTVKKLACRQGVHVTSNYSGRFHTGDDEEMLLALTRQLGSPVRWVDNMEEIAAVADVIYEIGPSRPLREFFKSLGVNCYSITTLTSAVRLFAERS
ncbi:MAG: hypothetical protein N2Z74_03290 [Syntrophales bacterium]|nr:hypothetical protein [Syntrophales bacterium]